MLKNAITLFVGTVIILVLFIPSYTKMQDLKQRNRDYAARIVELENTNQKMNIERGRLKTDPDYLEKVAREKMGLIKEGEKIYKAIPAQ